MILPRVVFDMGGGFFFFWNLFEAEDARFSFFSFFFCFFSSQFFQGPQTVDETAFGALGERKIFNIR